MSDWLFIGAGLVLLLALLDWRLALLLTLSVGFLQDVVRKLTPGEPLYMVMLFAPVFAIAAQHRLKRIARVGVEWFAIFGEHGHQNLRGGAAGPFSA